MKRANRHIRKATTQTQPFSSGVFAFEKYIRRFFVFYRGVKKRVIRFFAGEQNMSGRGAGMRRKKQQEELLAVARLGNGTVFLCRREGARGARLVLQVSADGRRFTGNPKSIRLRLSGGKPEDVSRCANFRMFSNNSKLYITYVARGARATTLRYAELKPNKASDVRILKLAGDEAGVVVGGLSVAGHAALYYGTSRLKLAVSTNGERWKKSDIPHIPQWNFFEGRPFQIAGAFMMDAAIAVLYTAEVSVDTVMDVEGRDEKTGEDHFIKTGVAMFDAKNPARLLWQSELPLLEIPLDADAKPALLGIVPVAKAGKPFRVYIGYSSGVVGYTELPADAFEDHKNKPYAKLERHAQNPILMPTDRMWEAEGAFNPTAVSAGGFVHLLYRAVGRDGASYIGYAASKDGSSVDERLVYPAYAPRDHFEPPQRRRSDAERHLLASGGSWGGCEDPKATVIDDRLYMTYVAHTGYWPTRTALTSISLKNFLKKIWRWKRPMLMSAPNVGSKSVVILPEKIDGNYVIFHRVWPSIVVDVVPSLEFGEGKRWLQNTYVIPPRHSYWDSMKISMGAAPIKCEDGWIAVYNAVDRRDSSKYQIGAMLLDEKKPWIVRARTNKPILSPDAWYENAGKPGITYPGGVVEIDGILHVYYGGGDKVSCVATIPTRELLWHLKKDRQARVTDIKHIPHVCSKTLTS